GIGAGSRCPWYRAMPSMKEEIPNAQANAAHHPLHCRARGSGRRDDRRERDNGEGGEQRSLVHWESPLSWMALLGTKDTASRRLFPRSEERRVGEECSAS